MGHGICGMAGDKPPVGERWRVRLHLGGPERLSRRSLLGAVLGKYRKIAKPMAEVVECSLRDIPVLESRPLDSSLRPDRFKADFGKLFRAAGEVARVAVQSYFVAQDAGK